MPSWYRIIISFRGAAEDHRDAVDRARALFGDLPVPNLKITAEPLGYEETMRMIDSEESKKIIEADVDSGQGVLMDIMGVEKHAPHPHRQGAWVFPDGHPLAPYERLAAQQRDRAALNSLRALSVAGKPIPELEIGGEE